MTESRAVDEAQAAGSDQARADRAWLAQRARAAGLAPTLTVVAGTAAGWGVIPQAGLLAWLVHAVTVEGSGLAEVGGLLGLLFLVVLFRSGAVAVQEWSAAETAYRVHRHARERIYDRLLGLGPAGLGGRATGALATALLEQVAALGPFAARYRPQMVLTVIVPVAILITVLMLDWLAALLLLFAAPLIPAFMAIVGMGAEAVSRSQHEALARLGGYFLDRLQGLDLLRHLGRAENEATTLAAVGEDYRRRTMAVLRVAFLSSAVLEFFSSVAIAMVAVYIGMGLLGFVTFGPAPELTLFTGQFVLLLAPEFFQPLRQLAQHYHDRAAALGAAAELRPLDQTPSPMPAGGTKVPPPQPPHLVLERVSLRGDGEQPILAGIDLDIAPGEAILLTGPSGSGKTSLLEVLAGFRDVDAGVLRINGDPLSELDLDAWQQRLAWLAQTPYLFPGRIIDNLAPNGSMPPDAAASALDRAGATAFVRQRPEQLETRLGERGQGLSGGEGQRLALARALLRGAPLMLVDEPTASLDPETAEQVSQALQAEHQRGATVIIASHAGDLFPWVQRTIRLRHGRLVGAPDD